MTGLHGLASLFPLTFHMHLIEKEYLSSALSALAQNPMIGLSYGSLDIGFRYLGKELCRSFLVRC